MFLAIVSDTLFGIIGIFVHRNLNDFASNLLLRNVVFGVDQRQFEPDHLFRELRQFFGLLSEIYLLVLLLFFI